MTKLNIFRSVDQAKQLIPMVLGLILMFFANQSFAQCPQSLGCNDNVQISLDYDCYAVIHPNLLLEDEMEDCPYMVTISDLSGNVLATTFQDPMTGDLVYPSIDGSYVGASWIATVFYTDDLGNIISCWGFFTVEDKLPPTLTCIEDFTVDCAEDLSELYTSQSTTTYCNDNPVDIGVMPGMQTIELSLINDGSHPWEIIESIVPSIPLAPLSGSGSTTMGPDTYSFTIDGANGFILNSEFEGVQTQTGFYQNTMTLTVSNVNDLTGGICLQFNSTSFSNYQTVDNCDPATETVINKDEITDLQCSTSQNFTARRDIEYFTRDNVGLSQGICAFSIHFEKKSLTDLDWPDNIIFDCDDPAILDENGQLDLGPELTGYPLLDGDDLHDDENYCRINVTFQDDTFNICGANSIKILRRWTALDWCEGLYTQSYQTIKVHDLMGPEVICPDDGIKFYANGHCTADVFLRPLDPNDTTRVTIIRECSSFTIEAEYLDEFGDYQKATALGGNRFVIRQLHAGVHTIKYIFTDECLNRTECTFDIIVQDAAPPIPVCDQFTAVTLANNGWARAYTETFDDGSYDECGGPLEFEIRRTETACEDLAEYDRDDLLYGKYVQFCCEEVGDTVDVVMKVTDEGGRANTCLIKVIVQDKTPYTVTCPQKYFDFDCSEYKDTFNIEYPVFTDNCTTGNLSFVDSGNFNADCGTGVITRNWFVEINGTVNSLSECQQTFNLTNKNILNHDSFQWPAPIRTDATCANYRTNLGDAVYYKGVPVNEADICGLLAYSYSDRVFYDVEGYCLKILRTWSVVDWCTYEPNIDPYRGIWRETQTIKIASADGPILESCGQDTVIVITTDTCSITFNHAAPTAFDQCLSEFIDIDELHYVVRDRATGLVEFEGNGHLPNVELPVGFYRISWSAEGMCNNISTCSFNIDVLDGKSPQPYCKAGITTVLMPPGVGNNDPEIEIWASDFDLNSTDNCDNDLEFSFDPIVFTPNLTFTCDDLGTISLEVWIIDDSGNKDYCLTTINIQANNGICPDSIDIGNRIAGYIATEKSEMLENVEVSLEKMQIQQMAYNMTGQTGEFAFDNLQRFNDYKIKAKKNDDYLNGVSTLDLIMIQRHILGLQQLDSPYKIVAADINNNKDISAIDLIELRKLILGIYEELPQNDSWRFIDAQQQFSDYLNPWPLDENINILNLDHDMMTNDFVAVKIGDVNGSFEPINNQGRHLAEAGNKEAFTQLNYDILALGSTSEYLIPVYFNKSISMYGLQLSLNVTTNDIEFVGIESGKLAIDAVNYSMDEGNLIISWNDSEQIAVDNEETLFYVTIKSNRPLSEGPFRLNDLNFANEIYKEGYNIERLDLAGMSRDGLSNNLFQNIPNPFSNSTNIEFELVKGMEVTIKIVDTNGSLVRTIKDHFKKGRNTVSVNSSELKGNGIYYFIMESEAFSATRKMILIE